MDQTRENQPTSLSDEFLHELVQQAEQLEVAEQALAVVREAVEQIPFTEEEQQWLKNWT